MSRRFIYDRLTSEAFCALLERLEMSPRSFARITGANPSTVDAWAIGDQDIPAWCTVMLHVFEDCPGAIVAARRTAAIMICTDRQKPGVLYPFRNREEAL